MSRISRAAVALLLTLGLLATFAAPPRADEMPAVRVLTGALSNEAEAIAQRLAGALRFKTISYQDSADFRPEPFDALNAYLRKTYPATYAALDTQVVAGYSLLLEWKGSDASLPPALFLSHTDVVPIEPGTEEGWTHPPFAGTVADGYIWGRGTLDTKESVLAYHEAIERLLGEGWSPKRSLFFAFGHDEEIGGRAGAGAIAALLAERGVHFEFGVDEGGFILDGFEQIPDRHVALISTAEKTYFTVELVARGPGGHSSMPPVRSSVGRLATALDKLEKEQMDLKLCEPVREQLERMAPELSFGRRLALQNLWLFKGLVMRGLTDSRTSNAMVRTTTALTLVSAGVKENVVPQEARASVNFRILPCETPDDVLEHVRRTIDDPDIECILIRPLV